MTPSNPHLQPLTPADIMLLRASVSTRSADGTNGSVGVPFIVYIPSDDAFALHAYGACQCVHEDPRLLAQMLRCERAEKGFIARVLSPLEPCTVAGLSPDERARFARHQANVREQQRASREAAEEAARRRANMIDPSCINLDNI